MPTLRTYNQIDQALGRYPLIRTLFELAEQQGTPIYLVGGTVRDLLLGRETHDLDFVVQGSGLALARDVADQLGGFFVPLDHERRTGRVLLPRPSREAPANDEFASSLPPRYLDIASLRGDSLLTDLQGRDFCLNAIAIGPAADAGWRIHDPLGGIEDLRQKSLRMASPTSFDDDPVRTLRAVRLQVQFDLRIRKETRKRLHAAVPLLGRVSAERIRDEWFKLLALPSATTAIREMAQLGLLHQVAPPLALVDLGHALETVDAVECLWAAFETMDAPQEAPRLPLADNLRRLGPPIRHRYRNLVCDERSYLALLKCAALLHAAKLDLATLAERWRLSKRETELLQTAIQHCPDVTALVEHKDTSRRSVYRFFAQTGEPGIDAAILSLAHTLAERDLDTGHNWMLWTETVGRLLQAWFEQQDTLISPALLLSGRDVMRALDLPPGPQIGELLQRLAEEQAAGEVLNRQQALTFVQQWKAEG